MRAPPERGTPLKGGGSACSPRPPSPWRSPSAVCGEGSGRRGDTHFRAALSRAAPPSQRPARRALLPHPCHERGGGVPQSTDLQPKRCPPPSGKVGLSAVGPGNMLGSGAAAPALPLEASFSSLGLITFPLIDPSLGGKIPGSFADSGWTQRNLGRGAACVQEGGSSVRRKGRNHTDGKGGGERERESERGKKK